MKHGSRQVPANEKWRHGTPPVTTILILDDNSVVLRMLGLVLRAKSGYEVLEAATEQEAAALIERHPEIELLVADVCLDGQPGRVIADRLVALCPRLRVLFISGYPKDHLVGNGLLEAGDAFLAKPFPPERLMRTVNEILENGCQPPTIAAGAVRTLCAGGA